MTGISKLTCLHNNQIHAKEFCNILDCALKM